MPGIAGVVLLYYPDSQVFSRMQSYLHHLDRLYVIDNSETPVHPSIDSTRIVYIHDGINQGIASRLNQAAQLSIDEGYDWLLTMDQDSEFTTNSIRNYLECARNFYDKENTGVFGVQFNDPSLQGSDCRQEDSLDLITSGSLVNLKLFPFIGPFDEALFIDQVDFDYSFRCRLKGYKTIRFKNIYLQHSLGKETEHISLKNFKKTKRSLHTPIRIYYMARNYLYMRSKYSKQFPEQVDHMKKDLSYRLKNNMLYNPKRLKVMQLFVAGIIDFYQKKMGKRN